MKKILLFTVALFSLFSATMLTSCNKDEDASLVNTFVSVEGTMTTTITFNADGTYVSTTVDSANPVNNYSEIGTYNDNKTSITLNPTGDASYSAAYSIDGDILSITADGLTYTYTKA